VWQALPRGVGVYIVILGVASPSPISGVISCRFSSSHATKPIDANIRE